MNATGEDIVKHLPMELIDWFKDTTLVIVKHGGQVEGYQFSMYPSLEEDSKSNYTVVNMTLNATAAPSDTQCNYTCNCTNETKHEEEVDVQAPVEPPRNLTLDELLEQIQALVPNATIDRSNFSINITLIEQNFTVEEPETVPNTTSSNHTCAIDLDDDEEDVPAKNDTKTTSKTGKDYYSGYMTVKSY